MTEKLMVSAVDANTFHIKALQTDLDHRKLFWDVSY
jgi:hypothetical protein